MAQRLGSAHMMQLVSGRLFSGGSSAGWLLTTSCDIFLFRQSVILDHHITHKYLKVVLHDLTISKPSS